MPAGGMPAGGMPGGIPKGGGPPGGPFIFGVEEVRGSRGVPEETSSQKTPSPNESALDEEGARRGANGVACPRFDPTANTVVPAGKP